jgi:hypothetical protein
MPPQEAGSCVWRGLPSWTALCGCRCILNFYSSRRELLKSFSLEELKPAQAPDGSFANLIGPVDHRPRAILFRQVATPNYELRHFLRGCRRHGFEPVILRYHADRMSCHNQFKRSLVHPMFVKGLGRNGSPYFVKRPLLRIDAVDNTPLREIGLAGTDLPDFHDRLLREVLPEMTVRTVEASGWFGQYARGARDYYVDLFCGLTNGLVLFEDFISDGQEARFFADIVRPAFDEACRRLGHSPSVVPLCANRRMVSPLWYAYPESYWPLFQKLGVEA